MIKKKLKAKKNYICGLNKLTEMFVYVFITQTKQIKKKNMRKKLKQIKLNN